MSESPDSPAEPANRPQSQPAEGLPPKTGVDMPSPGDSEAAPGMAGEGGDRGQDGGMLGEG